VARMTPQEVAAQLKAAREELIGAIRRGDIHIDAPGETRETRDMTKVVSLTEAVPGLGKVGARKILDDLGIDHATRWGELGDQRAKALLSALAAGASPAAGQ
jgi:S13-like protein